MRKQLRKEVMQQLALQRIVVLLVRQELIQNVLATAHFRNALIVKERSRKEGFMSYFKPVFYAQTAAEGSYAATCPMRTGITNFCSCKVGK